MKTLLAFSVFAASLFGQSFESRGLSLFASKIQTNPDFIPGARLPIVPGAKPGYVVMFRRTDGSSLTADAYRITIRYTRDGMTFEQSKYAKPDRPGVIFEVVGVLVSATVTPILPFEERIQ